jgi:hypothetical protein
MNKPNALPRIRVNGVEYFVDFRLEEIRPTNMPFMSIYFDDLTTQQEKAIRRIKRPISTNN